MYRIEYRESKLFDTFRFFSIFDTRRRRFQKTNPPKLKKYLSDFDESGTDRSGITSPIDWQPNIEYRGEAYRRIDIPP